MTPCRPKAVWGQRRDARRRTGRINPSRVRRLTLVGPRHGQRGAVLGRSICRVRDGPPERPAGKAPRQAPVSDGPASWDRFCGPDSAGRQSVAGADQQVVMPVMAAPYVCPTGLLLIRVPGRPPQVPQVTSRSSAANNATALKPILLNEIGQDRRQTGRQGRRTRAGEDPDPDQGPKHRPMRKYAYAEVFHKSRRTARRCKTRATGRPADT